MALSIDFCNYTLAELADKCGLKKIVQDAELLYTPAIHNDHNAQNVSAYCSKVLEDRAYFSNYFSADDMFGTIYLTEMVEDHFITVDLKFNVGMKVTPKFAVKKVSPSGIETVFSAFDHNGLKDCINYLYKQGMMPVR